MKELTIKLSDEDMEILDSLLKESNDYANNLPLSYSDVVSSLLCFYDKAKLVSYHKIYKKDIPMYIGNRAINKYK